MTGLMKAARLTSKTFACVRGGYSVHLPGHRSERAKTADAVRGPRGVALVRGHREARLDLFARLLRC
jgi:hypothetical protein